MIVRAGVLLLSFVLLGSPIASCGKDAGKNLGKPAHDGSSGAGDPDDAGLPAATASDPCLTAGYHFDGKSDCDVVRCPDLSCECPVPATTTTLQLPPETISLHACVQGRGCVVRADCSLICDSTARLNRLACQERLRSTGAGCSSDHDCVTGHCREESVGTICVDMLGCGDDGHCSAGSRCRFEPGSIDKATGAPTSLGSCSDGASGSVCYADEQCTYHKCAGNRCAGGRDNDACDSNANCASGFCRITSTSTGSGYCVSGERGGSCADDGDCGQGLHCTSGACFSSTVGQACDEASDCASGLCVSSLCRGGEAGSVCQEDAHCLAGFCVGGLCVSGGLFSPCSDAGDCSSGLRCAYQVCSDGTAGSPCSIDTDCAVRACVRYACSAGDNGNVCDAPDDCQSNRCADPAGVEPGECTSGAKGSHCINDQNCVSSSCSLQGTCD